MTHIHNARHEHIAEMLKRSQADTNSQPQMGPSNNLPYPVAFQGYVIHFIQSEFSGVTKLIEQWYQDFRNSRGAPSHQNTTSSNIVARADQANGNSGTQLGPSGASQPLPVEISGYLIHFSQQAFGGVEKQIEQWYQDFRNSRGAPKHDNMTSNNTGSVATKRGLIPQDITDLLHTKISDSILSNSKASFFNMTSNVEQSYNKALKTKSSQEIINQGPEKLIVNSMPLQSYIKSHTLSTSQNFTFSVLQESNQWLHNLNLGNNLFNSWSSKRSTDNIDEQQAATTPTEIQSSQPTIQRRAESSSSREGSRKSNSDNVRSSSRADRSRGHGRNSRTRSSESSSNDRETSGSSSAAVAAATSTPSTGDARGAAAGAAVGAGAGAAAAGAAGAIGAASATQNPILSSTNPIGGVKTVYVSTMPAGSMGTLHEQNSKGSTTLSGGAIAGIVIGCIAGFLLLCGLIYVLVRKNKDQDNMATHAITDGETKKTHRANTKSGNLFGSLSGPEVDVFSPPLGTDAYYDNSTENLGLDEKHDYSSKPHYGDAVAVNLPGMGTAYNGSNNGAWNSFAANGKRSSQPSLYNDASPAKQGMMQQSNFGQDPNTSAATTGTRALSATRGPVPMPTPTEGSNPDVPEDTYIIVRTFEPSMPDELRVQPGDRVELYTTYDDGWALGVDIDAPKPIKGVFPCDCIAIDDEMDYSHLVTKQPGANNWATSKRRESSIGSYVL